MKSIQVGAGNIGRGFIGLILHQSNYELSFADVNETLINQINELKSYRVVEIGNETTFLVEPIQGFNINKDLLQLINEMTKVSLITTAVGASILPKIAPIFASAIEEITRMEVNSFLNIIACENVVGGTDILKNEIIKLLSPSAREYTDKWIGFPNSAVDRIVPIQSNNEPLLVSVEPYFEWIIDETSIKGSLILKGATFTKNLDAYIQRKLYLVNAGHAAIAYAGYLKVYSTIYDSLKDIEIYNHVYSQMKEASALLIKKFNFTEEELDVYISQTLIRFSNPLITDSIFRVCRSPLRKLSHNDRFIKPLIELYEYGLKSDHFEESIRNALKFNYDFDEESIQLQRMVKEKGLKQTVLEVCSLPENHPAFLKITS